MERKKHLITSCLIPSVTVEPYARNDAARRDPLRFEKQRPRDLCFS